MDATKSLSLTTKSTLIMRKTIHTLPSYLIDAIECDLGGNPTRVELELAAADRLNTFRRLEQRKPKSKNW